MEIELRSRVFVNGGMIPLKYTCEGADVSPPLMWGSLPPGTVSIALIVDDPDAPVGTWVHWVIYNIPSEVRELAENIPQEMILPEGDKQGINDFNRIGYGGPCPPGGTHRYFFKLYALDIQLDLPPGITKKKLLRAMEGHIIGRGGLMGRYSRST